MRRVNTPQKNSWFLSAFQPSAVTDKKVTLVADLDETLFCAPPRLEYFGNPEKFSQSIKSALMIDGEHLDFQADPNAFAQLSAFQKRGHKIMVVTCATYPFKDIQGLFQQFGVELSEEDYHNRTNMKACGLSAAQKPEYIDLNSTIFTHDCMLFDNAMENKPGGDCLFFHVNPNTPFPNLEIEFYNALVELAEQLAACETHNDSMQLYALNAPIDITNTFSEILYCISKIPSHENLFRITPLIARAIPLLNALNALHPLDFNQTCIRMCQQLEAWKILLTSCSIKKMMDVFSETDWRIIFCSENAPEALYQILLTMAVNTAVTVSHNEPTICRSFQELQLAVHSGTNKYSREEIEKRIAKQRITNRGSLFPQYSNIGADLNKEAGQYLTIAAELETTFPTLSGISSASSAQFVPPKAAVTATNFGARDDATGRSSICGFYQYRF